LFLNNNIDLLKKLYRRPFTGFSMLLCTGIALGSSTAYPSLPDAEQATLVQCNGFTDPVPLRGTDTLFGHLQKGMHSEKFLSPSGGENAKNLHGAM
jgi:hypothetical protein